MGRTIGRSWWLAVAMACGAAALPAVALAADPSPSPAPAAGTFTAVGAVAARDIGGGRTQTLLPDGRVLIIDGEAAQLWDPATGALAPAGTLSSSREWDFTNTLMPDGRVLVVGGVHHRPAGKPGPRVRFVGAMEAWDPATRSFVAFGDVGRPRAHHTTIVLPDGSATVVGGQDDRSWVTVGERHHPDDPLVAEIPFPRRLVDGTGPLQTLLLGDGRVLLSGGPMRDGQIALAIWDPADGRPQNLTPVRVPPPALLLPLPDGRVLIAGTGRDLGCLLMGPCDGEAAARVWDPATGRATALFARGERLSVNVLPDGRVLAVWGGTTCDTPPFASPDACRETPASAEAWDPTTGTATPAGTFPGPVHGLGQGVVLADGRVLVQVADVFWVVDPIAASIRPAGVLPAPFQPDADLVPLPDGRALVVDETGTMAIWAPGP